MLLLFQIQVIFKFFFIIIDCYLLPHSFSISSLGGTDVQNIQNWSRTSLWHVPVVSSVSPYPWVRYGMNTVDATVNAFELWPGGIIDNFPRGYSIYGSNSITTSEETLLLSKSNQVATTFAPIFHINSFITSSYHYYKLNIIDSNDNKFYLSGFHLAVCKVAPPSSIEYATNQLVVYANVDSISLVPLIDGFTNCTVNPSLPTGLVLNEDTCSIHGIPSTIQSQQTYTITSSLFGGISGIVSITVQACEGGVVKIERIYGSNSAKEGYSIKADTVTIYQEDFNQNQQSETTVVTYFCIAASNITIDLSCMNRRWESNSYLNVYKKQDDIESLLLHTRFDSVLGLSTHYEIPIETIISIHSSWSYKMNTFTSSWITEDSSTWQISSFGNFPNSTNHLQFYRSSFTMPSLSNIILLLHFHYGCIIYINGQEVFRKNIIGDISTTNFATGMVSTDIYHSITIDSSFLEQGLNQIAIALIGTSPILTTSVFDCSILPLSSSSRISEGLVVETMNALIDLDGNTFVSYSQCNATIEFDFTPRYEMISSILLQASLTERSNQPISFVIEAKNEDEIEWHILQYYSSIKWWVLGQEHSFFLNNHQAYSMYRLRDLTSEENCAWKLSRIDFMILTVPTILPNLVYEQSPISVYQNIEMAEVYPSSTYYTNFSIQPSLPTGIMIDPITGVLVGTPTQTSPLSVYIVTATDYHNQIKQSSISLEVVICYGSKSLITATIYTDSSPELMHYTIYRGFDKTGVVIQTVDSLSIPNSIVYGDFCLPHNSYTILLEGGATGWGERKGFILSVDIGTFRFDFGTVPHALTETTSSYETHFSSFLPFQMGFDKWRVWNKLDTVPEDWLNYSYKDSSWPEMKGMEIGRVEDTTCYVRKVVEVYGLSDYNVLNVKIKYQGGIIGYWNNRMVAKFNLPDIVTSYTEGNTVHSSEDDSFFHIVLHNQGAREGKNVMAFEIHRPKGQSSAIPVVFDATGVFMINECSVVRDTFNSIESSSLLNGEIANLFDCSPITSVTLQNTIGSSFQFSLLNQVPSQFTYFSILPFNQIPNTAFSLYGKGNDDEWITMTEQVNTVLQGKRFNLIPCTLGIIGLTQFKFELDIITTVVPEYFTFQLMNCKATGDICPGIDEYPTVTEGQLSPSLCPDGYQGYTYRICRNGRLGSIQYDQCSMKVPSGLLYESDRFEFVKDVYVKTNAPSYNNIITTFYLDENVALPAGLSLNPDTGVIEGTPSEVIDAKSYVIYGSNEKGVTNKEIVISVRLARCLAETVFPITVVGETAVYSCSTEGAYLGTKKRTCLLGERDGVWGKSNGTCIHVGLLVGLICILVLIVIIILFFLRNVFTRRKAVAGVKAKGNVVKSPKKVKQVV